MSIFRRQEHGDGRKTNAALASDADLHGARPAQVMSPTPPFSGPKPGAGRAAAPGSSPWGAAAVATAAPPSLSPGVVPPPEAPVYTMRPPDSATHVEVEAEIEKAREGMQKRVRVAVHRSRTAASAAMARAARPRARTPFDPVRAAQAGLLNLAWSWQQAGSPIRAIHAYMLVLSRYPDTPGAAAAVADLVELSDKLVEQGQYHMALGIYDALEQLL